MVITLPESFVFSPGFASSVEKLGFKVVFSRRLANSLDQEKANILRAEYGEKVTMALERMVAKEFNVIILKKIKTKDEIRPEEVKPQDVAILSVALPRPKRGQHQDTLVHPEYLTALGLLTNHLSSQEIRVSESQLKDKQRILEEHPDFPEKISLLFRSRSLLLDSERRLINLVYQEWLSPQEFFISQEHIENVLKFYSDSRLKEVDLKTALSALPELEDWIWQVANKSNGAIAFPDLSFARSLEDKLRQIREERKKTTISFNHINRIFQLYASLPMSSSEFKPLRLEIRDRLVILSLKLPDFTISLYERLNDSQSVLSRQEIQEINQRYELYYSQLTPQEKQRWLYLGYYLLSKADKSTVAINLKVDMAWISKELKRWKTDPLFQTELEKIEARLEQERAQTLTQRQLDYLNLYEKTKKDISEMAQELGVSQTVVYGHLYDWRINPLFQSKLKEIESMLEQEEKERMLKLYETTKANIPEIARLLGVTNTTVHNYFKRWQGDPLFQERLREINQRLQQENTQAISGERRNYLLLYETKNKNLSEMAGELNVREWMVRRNLQKWRSDPLFEAELKKIEQKLRQKEIDWLLMAYEKANGKIVGIAQELGVSQTKAWKLLQFWQADPLFSFELEKVEERLRQEERKLLLDAYERNNGNIREMAITLKVNKQTIRSHLKSWETRDQSFKDNLERLKEKIKAEGGTAATGEPNKEKLFSSPVETPEAAPSTAQQTQAQTEPGKQASVSSSLTLESEDPVKNPAGIGSFTGPRSIPDKSDKGGIDFRTLPIVNQQINMGMLKLSAADLKRLNRVNLDLEWGQIQNMVNAGIIPSNERIKEYVLSSCLRQTLGKEMDKVLGCIADIMRMEEERVLDTKVELRDMIVLLEAGKPESELWVGLAQIKISPQEPQLYIAAP